MPTPLTHPHDNPCCEMPTAHIPIGALTASMSRPVSLAHPALARLTIVLVVLVGIYQLVPLLLAEIGVSLVNVIGPIILLIACLSTAYQLVSEIPLAIWTPIPWLLAASATYFGLGPLAYTLGTDEMVANMDVLYPVSQQDLWWTNVLNVIGLLAIALSFLGFTAWVRRKGVTHPAESSARRDPQRAMMVFFAIGLPAKWLLILPYEFGLLTFVLPGTVIMLEYFVYVGFLLFAYRSVTFGKEWTSIFFAFLTFDFCVNFLRFGKESLLLGIIMAGLGFYYGNRQMKKLVPWAAIAGMVYILVSPFVTSARNELVRRTGNHYEATLSERLDVAVTVLQSGTDEQAHANSAEHGWWQRLCYANGQSYAMHAYESGAPGDTLAMAPYAIVPRFLFPDKPVLTEVGIDFTELVFGHRYSSTGIGVFGEAYWNGGWGMVLLIGTYIGALFTLLSHIAMKVTSEKQWLLLPCVLLGVRMGFRIDGWFVADYFGTALIYLVYFLVVFFFTQAGRRIPALAPH